jgi:hypothetical protein
MSEDATTINIHSNIFKVFQKLKTYRNIRKYLRFWGFTRSEQDLIIKMYKNAGHLVME